MIFSFMLDCWKERIIIPSLPNHDWSIVMSIISSKENIMSNVISFVHMLEICVRNLFQFQFQSEKKLLELEYK